MEPSPAGVGPRGYGGRLLRKEPCFSWSWPHTLSIFKEHGCPRPSLQDDVSPPPPLMTIPGPEGEGQP